MPRVPLPQVPLETGASTPIVAPRTVPTQDTAGRQLQQFGQSLTQFGVAVRQVATALQEDLDAATTKEAYTRLADFSNTALHAPDSGYLTKVGKAAVGDSRKQTLDAIEKKRMEIADGLQNDTQRRMFAQAANAHLLDVKTKVYIHEGESLRVYNLGQSEAMRAQSVIDAANSYLLTPQDQDQQQLVAAATAAQSVATGRPLTVPSGEQEPQDPQKPRTTSFELFRNTAVAQANETARLKGWELGGPQHQLLVLETTSAMHKLIVDGLIDNGRTDEAVNYLASVKPTEILPEVRTNLQRQVQRQGLNERATGIALDAINRFDFGFITDPKKPLTEMPVEVALDLDKQFKAGKITADELGRALEVVDKRYWARNQFQAGAAKRLLDEATAFISENPDAPLPARVEIGLEDAGMSGAIPGIRARINRPRAVALGKLIKQAEDDLEPIELEKKQAENTIKSSFASSEAIELAKKALPGLQKKVTDMKNNIARWKVTQQNMLGGMPDVDVTSAPLDPFDRMLQSLGEGR